MVSLFLVMSIIPRNAMVWLHGGFFSLVVFVWYRPAKRLLGGFISQMVMCE